MQKKAIKQAKESGIYFTNETEKAIIRYNKCSDEEEREKIYRDFINYPLNKLAENIINRFRFPYIDQSFNDTKKMVVSFLVMNLGKYTQKREEHFPISV